MQISAGTSLNIVKALSNNRGEASGYHRKHAIRLLNKASKKSKQLLKTGRPKIYADVVCFTQKHGCKHLVYYELIEDMLSAIAREKQFKGGSRKKKLALIEKINPYWDDLYEKLM